MDFKSDYTDLYEIASKLISKHRSTLDAGDLIGDAYLSLIYSGKEYCKSDFIRLMTACLFQEKNMTLRVVSLDAAAFNNQIKETGDTCCRKCKEVYPIGSFSRLKNNPFDFICDSCYADYMGKYNAVYHAKHKTDLHYKQQRAKACSDYMNRGYRKVHNEKMRAYTQQQKDMLTDIYIKTLLRGRGIKTADITPDLIEMERYRQVEKRKAVA